MFGKCARKDAIVSPVPFARTSPVTRTQASLRSPRTGTNILGRPHSKLYSHSKYLYSLVHTCEMAKPCTGNSVCSGQSQNAFLDEPTHVHTVQQIHEAACFSTFRSSKCIVTLVKHHRRAAYRWPVICRSMHASIYTTIYGTLDLQWSC